METTLNPQDPKLILQAEPEHQRTKSQQNMKEKFSPNLNRVSNGPRGKANWRRDRGQGNEGQSQTPSGRRHRWKQKGPIRRYAEQGHAPVYHPSDVRYQEPSQHQNIVHFQEPRHYEQAGQYEEHIQFQQLGQFQQPGEFERVDQDKQCQCYCCSGYDPHQQSGQCQIWAYHHKQARYLHSPSHQPDSAPSTQHSWPPYHQLYISPVSVPCEQYYLEYAFEPREVVQGCLEYPLRGGGVGYWYASVPFQLRGDSPVFVPRGVVEHTPRPEVQKYGEEGREVEINME